MPADAAVETLFPLPRRLILFARSSPKLVLPFIPPGRITPPKRLALHFVHMPLFRSPFLLALLLASQTGHGQNIVPGYVVTAGHDSLRGAVVVHDDLARQARVEFITLQGNQRLSLTAVEIKAYGYVTKRDTARYVAISLNYGSGAAKRVFLRQLVAGPVELYQYYYSPASSTTAPLASGTPLVRSTAITAAHPPLYQAKDIGNSRPIMNIFFPPLSARGARLGGSSSLLLRRRAQNAFVELNSWNFPIDAAAYFADYAALATDLRTKRYKASNIGQVLKRYNAWLATGPAHN